MKISLLLFFITLLFPALASTQTSKLQGRIINAANQKPLPETNIEVVNSEFGSASDSSGFFQLSLADGTHWLHVSSMGFKTKIVSATLPLKPADTLLILLEPQIIEYKDEISVYAKNGYDKIKKWLNSTEDILQNEQGITMLRRANFALEPSIRGLSAGQIGITIDGMKMYSACVDKMDPVSAYVEVENFEKMEISKGSFDMTNTSNIGGSINMVTKKADFNKPFISQMEVGYESVSNLQRIRSEMNLADSLWAMRTTFSMKKSHDYYTGDHQKVNNSGYTKNNYKVDLIRKLGRNHLVEFSFIGDNAWDIGYPVLLMDATKTQSQIYRFHHNWSQSAGLVSKINSTVYLNNVRHWMDDYKRDVANRDVMRNMYMPMFGKTRTYGLLETLKIYKEDQIFNIILDFHRLNAFADMQMESLFPDVSDMYLLNIGNAQLDNASIALDYNYFLSKRSRLRSNLRYDFSSRNIKDKNGQRLLNIYWESKSLKNVYNTFSGSLSFEIIFPDENLLQVSLAHNDRLPTHLENYGYYFYNYTDGFFYIGNPHIKPETSRQIEIQFQSSGKEFQFQSNVYFNDIKNYITGIPESDPLFEQSKIYSNISSAYITGVEVSLKNNFNEFLTLNSSFSYTYGLNRYHNEPLPLIPPFEGYLNIQYERDYSWYYLESRFASTQKRIANKTTVEDITKGFVVHNFRGRNRINDFIEMKYGVENLFNKKYHNHLSVNNLPALGRNFYLGLNFKLGS